MQLLIYNFQPRKYLHGRFNLENLRLCHFGLPESAISIRGADPPDTDSHEDSCLPGQRSVWTSQHLKAEITVAEKMSTLTLIHGGKITECGLVYSKNALLFYFTQSFQILDCNFTFGQLLNISRIVMAHVHSLSIGKRTIMETESDTNFT